ncbi:41014952-3011-4eab-a4ca-024b558f3c24 [Sclerotinia trifoliorum]|uniref:41014952-3011-4eab-a4ca-024b558f3c24 n=1 Tax=Sclerotinia trifoliorum TaxID=28548 RepID=A0A8H2ZMM9_9HELO|nr:41014952-3011-4eab-a4ca-024b558f3c24 [Sclerotinia trifoliorum]
MLNTEESCQNFIMNQSPFRIAQQIRQDQELCQTQGLPSPLALYLPKVKSPLGEKIAKELYPKNAPARYSYTIGAALYTGIVQGIQAYLHQMSPQPRHGSLPNVIEDIPEVVPSVEDIETTLKVLGYFVKTSEDIGINGQTPLKDVVQVLNQRLREPFSTEEKNVAKRIRDRRRCYICHFLITIAHPHYPALCKSCGGFNLASSDLSLPDALNLEGKTALVTGGRINLGFHTALRLLRCGAKVIVSSRYPRDACVKYLAEKDSEKWRKRLRIIGADFRAANDVFHLVVGIRQILRDWSTENTVKLDILINNAAQTWTDSIKQERRAIELESQLRLEDNHFNNLLLDTNYSPRVRGGVQSLNLLAFDTEQKRLNDMFPEEAGTIGRTESAKSISAMAEEPKTSWVQNLYEIPYEDVISAHSVNTFVPLILVRELLPLMGSPLPHPNTNNHPSKPLAHIINVSAREGVFEVTPTNRHKNGYHVHTNLTKAALNMLTETEAAVAWRDRKVAMNSVDPGYLSAAKEVIENREKNGGWDGCPIGWEDGAARVLWSVAVGESGKGAVWGRFLKDFGRGEGEDTIAR